MLSPFCDSHEYFCVRSLIKRNTWPASPHGIAATEGINWPDKRLESTALPIAMSVPESDEDPGARVTFARLVVISFPGKISG